MKILNLYAGIGGNRKLWTNCEVTAVEYSPLIAEIYRQLNPNDEVIITDAHEYLLNNYYRFDFIWASPPCQSHSAMRQNLAVKNRSTDACYPDMKLYQEIIFLQHNAKCKWVIENVVPYYKPLIEGKVIQRHMFWSNFFLTEIQLPAESLRSAQIPELQKLHGINLDRYKIKNKRQLLRNCTSPELGLSIYNDFKRNTNQ